METITSRQNPLMTHIRKLAGSPPTAARPANACATAPSCCGRPPNGAQTCGPWYPFCPGTGRCRIMSGRCWCRRRSCPPSVLPKRPRGCCSSAPFPFCRCRKRFRAGDMWCWTGARPRQRGNGAAALDAFDADGLLLTGGCAGPRPQNRPGPPWGRCSAVRYGA